MGVKCDYIKNINKSEMGVHPVTNSAFIHIIDHNQTTPNTLILYHHNVPIK